MSQENLNTKESKIQHLMEDLSSVGAIPEIEVVLRFLVHPNEYLWTNTTKFIVSYWERRNSDPKVQTYFFSDSSIADESGVRIRGVFFEVDKFIADFREFPWVDETRIFEISRRTV